MQKIFALCAAICYTDLIKAKGRGPVPCRRRDGKNMILISPSILAADFSRLGEEAAAETGSIGLPQSNAYANEIRYFADCVIHDKAPDRVKLAERETVIDLLSAF